MGGGVWLGAVLGGELAAVDVLVAVTLAGGVDPPGVAGGQVPGLEDAVDAGLEGGVDDGWGEPLPEGVPPGEAAPRTRR